HDFITCCADHLEQQLYPLTAWGTEYVAVRSMPRGAEKDAWRILAAENDTQVTVTPALIQIPTLNAAEWYEFETNEDFLIQSNRPILVGQFLAAEHAPAPGSQPGDADTGDPAFMLAVPVRQYRDSYVFLAPDQYEQDFVSISLTAGTVARLDGEEVDDIYPLLPDSKLFQINDIAGTVWQAVRLRIADGYHVLTCESPCAVMVHGYDRFVSYGYPGGLNLEKEEEDL
ncbi:MAG: IgGFc-binding protein, partial [Myxococcota bacterium]